MRLPFGSKSAPCVSIEPETLATPGTCSTRRAKDAGIVVLVLPLSLSTASRAVIETSVPFDAVWKMSSKDLLIVSVRT